MGVLATRGDDDGGERWDLSLSGQPLDDPLDGGGDDGAPATVAIDLSDWPSRRRALLTERLELVELPHRWEGDEVVVAADDEAWIDRLIDQVDDEAGLEIDDDVDRLGYDLSEWSPSDVERLIDALTDECIPHGLDGDELVVHAIDEARVDELVEAVSDPDRPAPEPPPGPELLSELFLAVHRIGREPAGNDGRERLVSARSRLDPARPPYGVDPALWRSLNGAVEELIEASARVEGDPEAVAEMADSLHARLRPLV